MQVLALDHVQVAMPAGGEAAARAFYGDLLGLTEIAKPENLRARGGCWFRLGDRELHLGVDPAFVAAKKAHVALAVRGLDGFRTALAAAGRPVAQDAQIPGRQRFFTEDPFGNRIELMEYVG